MLVIRHSFVLATQTFFGANQHQLQSKSNAKALCADVFLRLLARRVWKNSNIMLWCTTSPSAWGDSCGILAAASRHNQRNLTFLFAAPLVASIINIWSSIIVFYPVVTLLLPWLSSCCHMVLPCVLRCCYLVCSLMLHCYGIICKLINHVATLLLHCLSYCCHMVVPCGDRVYYVVIILLSHCCYLVLALM